MIADLTATTFSDSTGMGELTTAHKRALATGTHLRLVLPPGPLTSLFALAGLDHHLAV